MGVSITSIKKDIIVKYLNEVTNFLEEHYQKSFDEQVRIPMEPGELGLGIDKPIEKFKAQVTSGQKNWDTLSKQLNTLYIYNMHKHPEMASKWRNKRETLAKWIKSKREKNPDFGK